MEYGRLGQSGLQVSKIIFGGMSIGSRKWQGFDWVIEEEQALKLLKKAYDVGIRTFDTADVYSDGESERIIGKFLKTYNIPRSTVVILTKVNFRVDDIPEVHEDIKGNWVNREGLSRKHIFEACEASISRLGTYIDVYQIHRFDPNTPKEETMKALHDLVEAGKVRYIGASSMRATQFAQMQFIAEKNNWTKFISMQNYYNAIYREEEREMVPFCKETGVGLIPWSPLARGILTRPFSGLTSSVRGTSDAYIEGLGLTTDAAVSIQKTIGRVEEVAKKRGVSMAQVATAWVVSKGCYPIVGFSKESRIDEAVAALSLKLTNEEVVFIEEVYEPQPVRGFFSS